jgi:pimeloyl-ACP methyl ester carboxylesterase
MNELKHSVVETNGIRMHIAEQGIGPLVVLCHGFPESWYSWRHQLRALADAGYRAVAPDMRGFGGTDAPAAIDAYTMLHMVGDVVGLVDALGERTAVIAGHDWGARVAWQSARLRPDRFRAVIGLSVPFIPRGPSRPTAMMPQTDDAWFYQLYFQQPGVAEEELQRDVRHTIRALLYSGSGEAKAGAGPAARSASGMVPRSGGFLTNRMVPATLPSWLTEADIDVYAGEFGRTGFRGGLNWYRNIDRNWELLAPFTDVPVKVPALYIAGKLDAVLAFRHVEPLIANLKQFVPQLRETILLEGCGHWTQQEKAAAVSAAMIGFLCEVLTS